MPKNKQETKTIATHYGIMWIAEPVEKPEEIMNWRYGKGYGEKGGKSRELDLPVAESMRAAIPSMTEDMLGSNAGDIKIVNNGSLLLATPPRVYEEWKYDFLKSDICVIGPIERETEIINRFNNEKKVALEAKKKAPLYIEYAKPCLDRLAVDGLIEGVLGRGSYFSKNGYPVKNDDIDFILLVNRPKYDAKKITGILKDIPRFSVSFISGTDKVIKKGEHPEMSFAIVSRGRVTNAKGNKYEKYVLADSKGIGLKHLPIGKSERLAAEFASLLPKHDNRTGIPRFPPNIHNFK